MIAAFLVSVAPYVPQSASTLVTKRVACTLAGLIGRITSLDASRWFFFLFGVGAFLVLSLPGCRKEVLVGGVLMGGWGWSLRFLVRVFLALAILGVARLAILAAALVSLPISPWAGQTEALWVGWVTLEPQIWHACEVLAGFTDITHPPFCDT